MLKIKRVLAGAVVAGVVTLTGALPASAGLELYADPDYRALLGTFHHAMGSHHNMSKNANEALTSFRNRTPFSVAFWHDPDKLGRCFTAAPNDENRALGFWDNDKVSSFQLGRAC